MPTQKIVLVTGSTHGLGKAIAKHFLLNGFFVIFHGLEDSDDLIKDELFSYAGMYDYVKADLSSPEEIKSLFSSIESKYAGVDILVNNAGIQHISGIDDFAEEKWNQVIAVNLSASFHTVKLALPHMRKNNWGRIINIASAHALVASVNKCAYVAAKHGMSGLTKAIALELAQTNITCNAICPGWILTDLVKKQVDILATKKNISFDEAKLQLVSEKQPSGEFVEAEQVAALAAFLSTDSAQQIRGSLLSIDGGWTAS